MKKKLQNNNEQTTLFDPESLAKGWESPKLLVSCDPRTIFESEADFEQTLMHSQEAIKIIENAVGFEIERIARQVRTGTNLAQRADLVGIGKGPTKPLAVIELMMNQLDGDHVTRPFGYACSLDAQHLVLVAPAFPQNALNLIQQLQRSADRLGITIHLIQLHTESTVDLYQGYFRLEQLSPRRCVTCFLQASLH